MKTDTATGQTTVISTLGSSVGGAGESARELTYNPSEKTLSYVHDTFDLNNNTRTSTLVTIDANNYQQISSTPLSNSFNIIEGQGLQSTYQLPDPTAAINNNSAAIANNSAAIERNTAAIRQNSRDIDKNSEGVAMSLALANSPNLEDYENFAFTMNIGTFEGENAAAFGLMGRVNRNITIQAGLGVGLDQNTIGAAGGIKVGW